MPGTSPYVQSLQRLTGRPLPHDLASELCLPVASNSLGLGRTSATTIAAAAFVSGTLDALPVLEHILGTPAAHAILHDPHFESAYDIWTNQATFTGCELPSISEIVSQGDGKQRLLVSKIHYAEVACLKRDDAILDARRHDQSFAEAKRWMNFVPSVLCATEIGSAAFTLRLRYHLAQRLCEPDEECPKCPMPVRLDAHGEHLLRCR